MTSPTEVRDTLTMHLENERFLAGSGFPVASGNPALQLPFYVDSNGKLNFGYGLNITDLGSEAITILATAGMSSGDRTLLASYQANNITLSQLNSSITSQDWRGVAADAIGLFYSDVAIPALRNLLDNASPSSDFDALAEHARVALEIMYYNAGSAFLGSNIYTALASADYGTAAYELAFDTAPATGNLPYTQRCLIAAAEMLGFHPQINGSHSITLTTPQLDINNGDIVKFLQTIAQNNPTTYLANSEVDGLFDNVVAYGLSHGYYVPHPGDGSTEDAVAETVLGKPGVSVLVAGANTAAKVVTLERINAPFMGLVGDASFTVGGMVHVPLSSFEVDVFGNALPPLLPGQSYLFDPASDKMYVVGGSTNAQYADGALIIDVPDGNGNYMSFAQGTYGSIVQDNVTDDYIVDVTGPEGTLLFKYNITDSTVTFASGLSYNLPADSNVPITEITTSTMVSVVETLNALSITVEDEEELITDNNDYLYPEQTPFNATGDVSLLGGGNASVTFSNPGPGAIVTGPETVTVEGNVYNVVENKLTASGDISRDEITNVQVLYVLGTVSLTEDQFNSFALFSGQSGPLSATDFGLQAASGGEFDASSITVDGSKQLILLEATHWSGTTLIGSSQDGQILKASLLGEDTLQAGDGADTVLVAGSGVNTLIGSSSGGTTFVITGSVPGAVAPGSGLAAGSVVDGNGSDNVLEAAGDLSEATISGVQTLNAGGYGLTLTADQFNGFGTIEGGGTLYAASGGSYDWSGQSVDFSSAYALSSDGTTLIGNANLYASEDGDDTLTAPDGVSLILDASDSTGDVTLTIGDGDDNTVYAGLGINTITLGEGEGNKVVAAHGLAEGSSVEFGNASDSTLETEGDISGATITDAYTLATTIGGVTLTATQLAGFSELATTLDNPGSGDITLNAASAGAYDLSGKTISAVTVTLNGSFGADTLTGSSDVPIFGDILNGGAGDDTINGGDDDDTIFGGDDNDTIRGGVGQDTIDGGAGNDNIQIFSGEVPSGETIDGGDGTDRLTVGSSGMTPLTTLANMEELYLNSGVTAINLTAAQLDDFSTITHQSGGSTAFSITAQAAGTYSLAGKTITGIPTLNGSSGTDTLTGSSGNDTLSGKAGADTISGGDGNDVILINSGEVTSGDSIDGGNGTDRLTVGNNSMNPSAMTVANMEELYLNSGVTAVTLSASQLADFETITQASSASFSITAAAAGTYSLAGKTISGAATLNGSSGADTLTGSSGADTVNGNAGNDLIEGGAGNDTLNGGNDTDILSYANAGSAITINLSTGTGQSTGGAGTDTISNFENLTGSAYNDALTGTSSANVILGGDGNDTISAAAGADTIDGGVGTNSLTGGSGNDTYMLARTYGASDIFENDSTGGNTDVLQLGDDIAPDQVWFTQSGNDLVVQVIGTGAQMTIQDWYSGSDYHVEQIVTDDEDVLDHSDVQNLVSAMSGLSVPETTTLSEGYHTALDSVIAANWA